MPRRVLLALPALVAAAAHAQVAPVIESFIPLPASSGWVQADAELASDTPQLVYVHELVVPGPGDALTSRLVFADSVLAGSPAAGTGAFLTITSNLDGATQRLDAETLAQWSSTSAYFNGQAITVRLWAYPNTGQSRVSLAGAIVQGATFEPRTICDTVDDRVPSSDNRQGRFGGGCTAWLINDTNSSLLTAGHCGASATSVMSFNLPLSSSTGGTRAAHPDDQYVVDFSSNQGLGGGTGNDWRYINVFPNPNHGLTPFQRYGVRHTLAPAAPAVAGQTIRITGYGTNAAPMPRELSQTQQTHTGPYASLSGNTVRYRTDTTGGNSGSCILDESTGLAIGIHTHGGCNATGGSNIGTAAHHPGLRAALAAPLGLAASGVGTVAGTLFAIGDQANNFGTLGPAPQNFAKLAQLGVRWQGLAFSPARGSFFAVDELRRLFTITPAGASTLRGIVTGPTNVITGLALDPSGTETLYAIQPSSGQLFRINTTTLAATAIGTPRGGTVRAIDFDATRNVLWGIDQSAGAARLVRISTVTGVQTPVGPLGAGIVDCGDLGVDNADGSLFTINAATDELLSIDPLTGAATSLGTMGGRFGSAFGLASSAPAPCRADFDTSGTRDVSDVFTFLSAWFEGAPAADFDRSGTRDVSDIFAYLSVWFAGCP